MLAQHLGQRQDEVGGGRARGQRTEEAHADDDGRREVRRLAEDRGLGFDSSGTPAEHPETVDHRGVRVGAHQGVGDRDFLAADVPHLDDLREVLEVDLVAYAHARRHEREVVESLLRPAQKRVTLAVALDLLLDVARVRIAESKRVHLDRVVDHQVDRHERVDASGVLAGALHGGPHRRQVHHRRDTGEVLHEDARGQER